MPVYTYIYITGTCMCVCVCVLCHISTDIIYIASASARHGPPCLWLEGALYSTQQRTARVG